MKLFETHDIPIYAEEGNLVGKKNKHNKKIIFLLASKEAGLDIND